MLKITEDLIETIKACRIAELAERSGVSEPTLRNWISGNSKPSLEAAQKVAFAAGKIFLLFDKLEEDEP